ncbi:hypothetical protein PR048_020823 [Dryococelus australis]|uniref:Uncharacterized protein n=1 Tax=Dryococelus australis TaxID=614101 RepID=A0ABQ9GWG9_9NEOP|nr:hypothetical protein PR048_020823 [Dryococelus australis]
MHCAFSDARVNHSQVRDAQTSTNNIHPLGKLSKPHPLEVAVAEQLACSPPTKTIRVHFPAGSLLDFRMWGTCRTLPSDGGFSRESPASPDHTFRLCSFFTSFHNAKCVKAYLPEDSRASRKHCNSEVESPLAEGLTQRTTTPRYFVSPGAAAQTGTGSTLPTPLRLQARPILAIWRVNQYRSAIALQHAGRLALPTSFLLLWREEPLRQITFAEHFGKFSRLVDAWTSSISSYLTYLQQLHTRLASVVDRNRKICGLSYLQTIAICSSNTPSSAVCSLSTVPVSNLFVLCLLRQLVTNNPLASGVVLRANNFGSFSAGNRVQFALMKGERPSLYTVRGPFVVDYKLFEARLIDRDPDSPFPCEMNTRLPVTSGTVPGADVGNTNTCCRVTHTHCRQRNSSRRRRRQYQHLLQGNTYSLSPAEQFQTQT